MAATALVDKERAPQIDDADRDAMHVLPLATVIIETPSLRRARLIKNAQLSTVVEMFADRSGTGSGQVDIFSLARDLDWSERHPDYLLLNKLVDLPSFDVYSLRILFRANNIPITADSALDLSKGKVQELSSYMGRFTRRLIEEVYRAENLDIDAIDDVMGVFRNPDVRMVQRRLKTMADTLGIGVMEIPKFLEDYGDVFLSLSYYRDCLARITPTVDGFLESLHELRAHFQLRRDPKLMKTCDVIQSTITETLSSINERFNTFDQSTDAIWSQLSAERFRQLEAMIKGSHTMIGGVLCALSVKMYAWQKLFPNRNTGGPLKRAEFVMSDMRPGIERIRLIEKSIRTGRPPLIEF